VQHSCAKSHTETLYYDMERTCDVSTYDMYQHTDMSPQTPVWALPKSYSVLNKSAGSAEDGNKRGG